VNNIIRNFFYTRYSSY